MNNSAFLSDSFKTNTEYRVKTEQNFIAINENVKSNSKSFDVSKYEKRKNNTYVVKSATSKKWSIKFKK